tara:strand:+ start:221 stop:604 length:384 start_codon:yes stop_codon:yes gene_type:complete
MGFIQTPVRKIMKRKLPNTQSLRKARADYREWLKERGLDKIKPKKKSSEPLVIEPIEERTGVPMGDKVPVMEKGVGSKKAEMRYTGKRKLIGIATMHKSNQVPVFADDDDESGRKAATEITLMKGNK